LLERHHPPALLIALVLAWTGSAPAAAQAVETTGEREGTQEVSLPSRITFQSEAMRHQREDPLPASVSRKDEPRALWLARLAAEGRRPLRLAWRPVTEGETTTDPFARLSLDVKGTPTLLPLYVAEPERWTRVMESLTASSTCPCAVWGGVNPGRVPDGYVVLGSVLRAGKNGSDVVLSWGASCGGGTDYTVHEGTIGTWYSHQAVACTTNGVTSVTVTPGPASNYYLVVPVTDQAEGSYGSDSAGHERPKSTVGCRANWVTQRCP
jgi:hypothetical protein